MDKIDRAYSYATTVRNKLISKGLKDFANNDTMGAVIGALTGTALAALVIKLTSDSLVKEIAKCKKALDETYSPMQRLLAKEIEEVNSKIVKSRLVGKSLGNIAGGAVIKITKNKAHNELIGATIGGYLSNVLVDAMTKKSRLRLEELLLEYNPTLSRDQLILRNKLEESNRKLGTRWTIGVIGGALVGGYLGKATSEVLKERKEKELKSKQ